MLLVLPCCSGQGSAQTLLQAQFGGGLQNQGLLWVFGEKQCCPGDLDTELLPDAYLNPHTCPRAFLSSFSVCFII